MSPGDVLLLFILLIATWYVASHLIARRVNKKRAESCGCETRRYIGGPTSLYLDLNCNDVKIELFINRLPWDNPINLAAAVLAGKRVYTVARLKADREIGVMDASRSKTGYTVVNTSTPRQLASHIIKAAEELGIWRVTTSGRSIQLLIPTTDCKTAVNAALAFLKSIPKI